MSVALQSKALDCATECLCAIKAQQHVSKSLIQAIAECGIECIETARSCEVGSVLPELQEKCRAACEACIEACKQEESDLQQLLQPTSFQHLKETCRECLESLSS